MASYIFGGNTGETPESVRQKRQLADMLLGRTQGAKNWGEGFGAIASGLASRWNREAADEGEKAGMASAMAGWQDAVRRALGGDTSSLASFGGGGVAVPQSANADMIRQGLLDRGLSPQVADAFMMNFADESSLNPSANEASPLVPGSRGGFGLAQWTGPRRQALEAFAAQRGAPVGDVNTQLDFLMSELGGPEASAYQAIQAAPDTGSAAAAIARNFLRPAQQHLDARVAKYMGGGNSAPTQVASLDPSIGMPTSAPQMTAQPQTQAVTPQVAQTRTAPQPVAQAGGNADLQYLLSVAGNPWLTDGQRSVIGTLIEQQMRQQDPMRQLQMQQAQQGLEKGQLEINALRNPKADPGYRVLTKEEAATLNLPDGAYQVGPDNKVYEIGGGGVNVNVGGDGQRMGTIPAGMAAVEDPTNPSGFRLEPIPGGPVAAEAAAAADKAGMRDDMSTVSSDTVIAQAAKARELIGPMTTGAGGWIFGNLPFSDAADMYRYVSSLKSTAAAENINQMRQSSPTGGALGNASDADIKLLQDKAGALDPASPRFPEMLDDYEHTLLRIIHGPKAGDEIFSKSRGEVRQPSQSATDPGAKQSAPGDIEDILKGYGL